ncbi:MAG: type I-E CRISPR-associated protein Cas5/CasD [Armatimonadia bacterium]
MPTLLLRLAGPLQSWGIGSRFSFRDTALEPTKSGVLGLLCAAADIPREDDETLAQLTELQMGVRVDREGRLVQDFHTVGGGQVGGRPHGVARANGGKPTTVLSRREYLADADFLVGLQHTDCKLLTRLDEALQRPVWPLCLGRHGFVPALPPRIGVVEQELAEALGQWPWRPRQGETPSANGLRLVLETEEPAAETRCDVPVSFRHDARRFRLRRVHTTWIRLRAHTRAGEINLGS